MLNNTVNYKDMKGRIIASYGNNCLIDYNNKTIKCINKNLYSKVVVGDEVLFKIIDNEKALIEKILPRKNTIKKLSKIIATNIDLMLIVVAPKPKYSLDIIDKYLIMAENANLSATIIINKIDLIDKEDNLYKDLSIYTNIGYDVVALSVKEGKNLKALKKILANNKNIFLGQSGVGKSSLIKEIIPDIDIRIAKIGDKSNLGKHTTTASFVYKIATGGYLIDSPGIRELQIDKLKQSDIIKGFVEFKKYIGLCQFRDCAHINEDCCEIKKRVEKGDIAKSRYLNYLKFHQ